ncbi:uncharacterized protein LOC107263492 isoform X1 [Cephus cinctus]|uniref:Uncharacterized protein LOC107263492 isoform X1 n=1 Tax=Cephus cinctus TaxID=211228 RepID=A0AAJ7R9K5_CEPCN|nr:uncharacterized protein LOC107263492 isoform X1 [Cephus cinctus]XP_024936585.1 uncharacterized protein LOC107263492 isoform X1 [Cephus cinctus]
MKKRWPCVFNQSRSPKNSPRRSPLSRANESTLTRSKSFHDSRKRRLLRSNAKSQCRSGENGERKDVRKEVFGSLESLFDVKKPINLPDLQLLRGRYYGEGDTPNSSPDSRSPGSPRPLVPSLFPFFATETNQEVNAHLQSENSSDPDSKEYARDINQLGEIEEEILAQESPELSNKMDASEEENIKQESEEVKEGDDTVEEDVNNADETGEEEDTLTPMQDINKEPDAASNGQKGKGDDEEKGAPSYPIPPGLGEGIPVKSGGRQDSIMSAIPLTDTAVMEEMKEADERCTVIAAEIEELKKELNELTNKENLTQEDTLKIKDKQESIMAKLGEFEKITRKLQRLLGLADPSSRTFAKMFEMHPYPFGKPGAGMESIPEGKEKLSEEEKVKVKKPEDEKKKVEEDDEYRFDIPQMEYPEDKLPRVIVCGYTEDKIPKIVVGDSEKTGKKRCFQNLTGKLNESLNMQEKLVKENAQLEGGRYKLEEALLEKDNAVDSLQRKVCGLQAEMRIVVKENTELSRQIASLNERVTTSACYTICTEPSAPGLKAPPSPITLATVNHSKSFSHEDNSCLCKCCLQEQIGDCKLSQPPTICVDPDSLKFHTVCGKFSYCCRNCSDKNFKNLSSGSPRLSGGACRESYQNISERESDMCCRSPATSKASAVPPARGACPAELENKLTLYGNNTKQLEQQLGSMETEVRNMQKELANVQRERQQLEQQRKLLKCTGPCAPCSCCPPAPSSSTSVQPQLVPCTASTNPLQGSSPPKGVPMSLAKMKPQQAVPSCSGPCTNAPMGGSTCPQQQLRDLREQYARLQDDYKSKLCEVSCLRADAEKMKKETREAKEEKQKADNKVIDLQERLKIVEDEKNKLTGSKEQLVEQEQALLVTKQRFREAQDELEELRSVIQDQASQLEDYRNKYLQAQEQVEEQRRQLELMEMDNARMNENVTLEIGRVKNQFQEKLAELAPLPDMLKQTQMKLQEAQQMRLLAERNCDDLSRELLNSKEKLQSLQNQVDILIKENQGLLDERGQSNGRWDDLEKNNSELRNENERMKNSISRFEDHIAAMQKRIDEKMHEVTQLTSMLEQVREDSARQVARTKERCETVRRTMQGQIAEMERQLAQCRATARTAQKDRDEIRQKMQGQINNLNEAFEQAQGRIRLLQGHVNYLKNSYSNIFTGQGQGESPTSIAPGDPPSSGQGYDSCDCNY